MIARSFCNWGTPRVIRQRVLRSVLLRCRWTNRYRWVNNAARCASSRFLVRAACLAAGVLGRPRRSLGCVAARPLRALALVDTTGGRWYEPELHRLKGALLLQQSSSNQTEAESCFHQAIAVAQNQQAKSWELRAATSLARLWHQQGKREEAHDLLAPVYNWFTEGFDTADLQDSKALLDALSENQR